MCVYQRIKEQHHVVLKMNKVPAITNRRALITDVFVPLFLRVRV